MGHEEHLIGLLRPLGVYDLGMKSVNRGELAAYGMGLDSGLDLLERMEREMSLATAESEGLDIVETLLPYHPASETAQERREALAALLRIGGDSFTLSAINDTISGCGIRARAAEGTQPGYVEISFPNTPGIPPAFEDLRVILEDILPCHLEITYLFWYNTWCELAQRVPTWGDAADTGMTWYELATWKA